MRGIPFYAGKREICAFFHEYNVNPDGVVLQENGGRHTGVAWVHIPGGESAAKEVTEQLHHQWMGDRYIELRHSRKAGACKGWSRDSSHYRL